ncbi:hypothetical protein B296_00043919 [Ensete ventricosum]|uniref:Uncharacterized protein n=1 Tax=Ensete ventricosum TaxID=4639 RepID=A0A426YWL8_ENSVE|nr:hypothetical protein B296_00043919 [Ensete ventricosum]
MLSMYQSDRGPVCLVQFGVLLYHVSICSVQLGIARYVPYQQLVCVCDTKVSSTSVPCKTTLPYQNEEERCGSAVISIRVYVIDLYPKKTPRSWYFRSKFYLLSRLPSYFTKSNPRCFTPTFYSPVCAGTVVYT